MIVSEHLSHAFTVLVSVALGLYADHVERRAERLKQRAEKMRSIAEVMLGSDDKPPPARDPWADDGDDPPEAPSPVGYSKPKADDADDDADDGG